MSKTTVSTWLIFSRDAEFRIRIPRCAARPMPTVKAVGVASPSAQGQAMKSKAMNTIKAWVEEGHRRAQRMAALPAMIKMAGTKTDAILSTFRCTGGLLARACSTIDMID